MNARAASALGGALLAAALAGIARAQQEAPAPLGPKEAIETFLRSQVSAGKPRATRAHEGLEMYWAIVWAQVQDRLQARAVERAERLTADLEARARAGAASRVDVLTARAWLAAARSAQASTRAQDGAAFYHAILGQRGLALDEFPTADLPDGVAATRDALAAAREAERAARELFEAAHAAHAAGGCSTGELVAAGSRLGEQEAAAQGAALLARRAHDRLLLREGRLLAHYGVAADDGGD